MKHAFKDRTFLISFGIFITANCLLYAVVLIFHSSVTFNRFNYKVNAHHFVEDKRNAGGEFEFFRGLGVYDGQWYLKIAGTGYPHKPTITNLDNKSVMDGLTYAFFPAYPFVIRTISMATGVGLEKAAFGASIIFLIADYILLYTIAQHERKGRAWALCYIVFFNPFSVFFRLYYAEGLFLFFLLLMCLGLYKQKGITTYISLFLLQLTKGIGYMLLFFVPYIKTKSVKKSLLIGASLLVGVVGFFMVLGYIQTQNPFYFFLVRSFIHPGLKYVPAPLYFIAAHVRNIVSWTNLPFHAFHVSKIDTGLIMMHAVLLIASYNKIKKELWYIWLGLYISVLLSTDSMSFARYQSVFFPAAFVIEPYMKGKKVLIWLGVGYLALCAVFILVINWYWAG